MSWINGFELMCYIIVAIMLVDIIRKRDWDSLYTFGAAALVGYFMELAAVRVTGIYFYNQAFWLSLGTPPYQFPVFGGLMWGGLTVYGLKLAEKLRFGKWMTALTTGFLIVTMDLLLDVAAIRLEGGFWTWVGNPTNFDITLSTFMSVIWVNFLGYIIEVPAVILLTLKKREKVRSEDWKRQLTAMFVIALGGIVITGSGSLAALFLNSVTGDAFSCIAFVLIWLVLAVVIVHRCISLRLRPAKVNTENWPILLFWLAMYGYCLASLTHLGLWQAHPWFMVLGILFTLGTAFLCLARDGKKQVPLRVKK